MTDEMLRPREVAEMLKVSLGTLKQWARVGHGPERLLVGRKAVRYRARDLEDFIDDVEPRRLTRQNRRGPDEGPPPVEKN